MWKEPADRFNDAEENLDLFSSLFNMSDMFIYQYVY